MKLLQLVVATPDPMVTASSLQLHLLPTEESTKQTVLDKLRAETLDSSMTDCVAAPGTDLACSVTI